MSTTSSPQRTFSVPRRFGLGAIMAFMTLFAVISGGLRLFDAPPGAYLFVGTLGAAVFLAQMYSTQRPRLYSALAGGFLFWAISLFTTFNVIIHNYSLADIWSDLEFLLYLLQLSFMAFVQGAIVGYVAGVVVASVFLFGDMLERRLRGGKSAGNSRQGPWDADEAALPPGTPVYLPDSCTPYVSEEAAQMASSAEEPARVKKIGPPQGVPVYNCIALVAPRDAEGIVHARAANIAALTTTGQSEREALQHLVGAFKIIVTQALAEGREPPLLGEPLPPQPGETERFIAIHL